MKAEDVERPAAMDALANLISRTARAACWAKDLVALSLVTPLEGLDRHAEVAPARTALHQNEATLHELSGLPLMSESMDCAGNPRWCLLEGPGYRR